MPLTETQALLLVGRLIAVAILFQTIEMFLMKPSVIGIWSWAVLKKEFESLPRAIQKILGFLMDGPNFFAFVLSARLLTAVWLFISPHPIAILILLISSLAISVRWRGTFNGGSDYMTLIILLALLVASGPASTPKVATGCLWYIAIQTCLSYFISGWAKLKQKSWRTGEALPRFLGTSIYKESPLLRNVARSPHLCLILSWSALMFEAAFPLAFFNPMICTIFIGLAIAFHLSNVYILGLNRFLFAWIAAYPALIYCSQ